MKGSSSKKNPKEFEKKDPSKERDRKSPTGDQKGKRKIMPCDGKGCDSACCFGCLCCEEKTRIISQKDIEIQEKDTELNSLREKISNLMNKLKAGLGNAMIDVKNENTALRKEKKDSEMRLSRTQAEFSEVKDENTTLKKKVGELEALITEYNGIINEIKQGIKNTSNHLKNDNHFKGVIKKKVEEINNQVEVKGKN
jgi:chromosome segregation ATPase